MALPCCGGQLGAQRQVLLDLLVLRLVQVELGVLEVAVYLRQTQISLAAKGVWFVKLARAQEVPRSVIRDDVIHPTRTATVS